MEAREYRTKDKKAWGHGPWQDEPDKISWVDEATGLDCLIVRNHGGALCGYVGVPETHPLFGLGYNETSPALAAALEARMNQPVDMGRVGMGVMLAAMSVGLRPTPDQVLDVHGGITFADRCQEPTEDEWLKVETWAADPGLLADAAKHPRGDSAERLRELREQAGMTLSEWLDYQQARRICHVSPVPTWWFGFDCSHGGDLSPKFDHDMMEIMGHARAGGVARGDTYKDRAYVERDVASLAGQLFELVPPLKRALLAARGTGA